jgi:hypothetical protein
MKRKVYFAFHYDDIMRVNNVRNAWKIDHPDSTLMRSFQDSSLWESKKLQGDDAVKDMIRGGVQYTSAVCVLVGTITWSRRWVRYEIARSVIDKRGLLAVHINRLKHVQRGTTDTLGHNPLEWMGIYCAALGQYRLYEKILGASANGAVDWQWKPYADYTSSVSCPPYLTPPSLGYVTPLSYDTRLYDFVADGGHSNIGKWIDQAATAVGR